MNLRKIISQSLYENKELSFWIKGFIIFFIIFNIFGMIISKDPWDDLYDLINSILVNVLAAFMFFVLVVYIPGKKSKRIKKKNFKIVFEITKSSILEILLKALDYKPEHDTQTLLLPTQFKSEFTDKTWQKIALKLTEIINLRDEIITELEILKSEIFFILTELEISDNQIYDFLKYLSIVIHYYKSNNSQNIDIQKLIDFLQKFYTGYNWSKKEYSKEDIIENILRKI